MINASTLKSDVQQDFEGGNSLSVDWDILIRRAVENLIDNCRPETLKKRVPIYGGLVKDLNIYYAPSDILVPSDLYDNEGQMLNNTSGTRPFKYLPSKTFYSSNINNTYTIEYINGVRFIVTRKSLSTASLTVDDMDALGTISGGSASLNEHDFLTGTGSIQATVTDSGTEIGDTLSTTLDITDYLKGISLVPVKMPTANNIASVELRLKTDDSNYYSVISTADSIGDYFNDGWNLVRFNLANSTPTGSPDSTDIAKWSVVVTTTSGNTETILLDKITVQKSAVYYLEYYSNKVFVNGTTSAWQDTVSVANSDQINVDRDVSGILHYELAILVERAGAFKKANVEVSFTEQLKRKYDAYWENHPSSEAPLSYSKSPEIDINSDYGTGRLQDDTESIT